MSGPGPEPIAVAGSGVSIAEAEDPNRPKRVLGFRDLLLFYVVTGISLRWIATAAEPSSIIIWISAWLAFYTPLALSTQGRPDEARQPRRSFSAKSDNNYAGITEDLSALCCNKSGLRKPSA